MKLFSRKAPPVVCRQAVEAVTAYLEGAMVARDRAAFEAHLAGCEHCTGYVEQIRLTIALTGSVEPEDLAPAAQDALVGVFRAWVAERT
jgi:anti-sigma factor RsiW